LVHFVKIVGAGDGWEMAGFDSSSICSNSAEKLNVKHSQIIVHVFCGAPGPDRTGPHDVIVFSYQLKVGIAIVIVCIGGWGVTPTGKSFRFVHARARSGCQVEFELKSYQGLFPFHFCHAEFSLFHCVAGRFPFSPCEIEVRSKDNRSEVEVKSK